MVAAEEQRTIMYHPNPCKGKVDVSKLKHTKTTWSLGHTARATPNKAWA